MPINKSEFKSHIDETRRSKITCIHKCNTYEHELWTPAETAKYLRLELPTLAKWRCQGTQPDLPWIKIGSRCFYEQKIIKAFVMKNTAKLEIKIT